MTRETRTAAKASARKEKEEEPNASKLPAGSGRGCRRAKPGMVDTKKDKKKTKPMPHHTVDVIRGRSENPVPNVEDLRRKIEEDAKACGRMVRTVSNAGSRKLGPDPTSIPPNEKQSDELRPHLASEGPSTFHSTSTYPMSGGNIVNNQNLHLWQWFPTVGFLLFQLLKHVWIGSKQSDNMVTYSGSIIGW